MLKKMKIKEIMMFLELFKKTLNIEKLIMLRKLIIFQERRFPF